MTKTPLCSVPGMQHVSAPLDAQCIHCGVSLPMARETIFDRIWVGVREAAAELAAKRVENYSPQDWSPSQHCAREV